MTNLTLSLSIAVAAALCAAVIVPRALSERARWVTGAAFAASLGASLVMTLGTLLAEVSPTIGVLAAQLVVVGGVLLARDHISGELPKGTWSTYGYAALPQRIR